MVYVVLITDGFFSDAFFFGGFNAACRCASEKQDEGYTVFFFRNLSSGYNPYFVLMDKMYDGYLNPSPDYFLPLIYESYKKI